MQDGVDELFEQLHLSRSDIVSGMPGECCSTVGLWGCLPECCCNTSLTAGSDTRAQENVIL